MSQEPRTLRASSSLLMIAACLSCALALGCGGSTNPPPADAGCTPTTCAASGGACGSIADGCGAMLMCFCQRGQICGAGGVPNVCAPTPSDGGRADAGPPPDAGPKIGTACETSADCGGSPLLCTAGFCTRTCSQTTQCNGATADRNGLYGGQYVCFPLGQGLANFCWPNGSGAQCTADGGACPRSGELCLGGRCQYPAPGSLTPRADMKCLRDADCLAGESCALYTDLDGDGRTEGLCLYRGDGDSRRMTVGEPCSGFVDCGSRRCLVATVAGQAGQCSALCRGNADCPGSLLCSASPLQGSLAEFPDQYVGSCNTWEGSRRACTSHAACDSGESCSQARSFGGDGGSGLVVSGVCRRHVNPAGATVGASCSRNADCRGDLCIVNPLTHLGYCSDTCWGGQSECANGTSCRPRMIDARNPATSADDLRAPYCLQTGLGAVCDFTTGCRRCASDAECAPALGWRCADDGVCRDPLGRCANPCYTGCSLDGGAPRGGCPTGSSCKTTRLAGEDVPYCERTSGGGCARLPVDQLLLYDHGRCGDVDSSSPQQDLCYFQSRMAVGANNTDAFVCGQACPASCPEIAVDGGTLATTCRSVYEFGVSSDGGILFGGYALSPNQCAPASSFVGQPRPDGGASDGGASDGGASDGGASDGG